MLKKRILIQTLIFIAGIMSSLQSFAMDEEIQLKRHAKTILRHEVDGQHSLTDTQSAINTMVRQLPTATQMKDVGATLCRPCQNALSESFDVLANSNKSQPEKLAICKRVFYWSFPDSLKINEMDAETQLEWHAVTLEQHTTLSNTLSSRGHAYREDIRPKIENLPFARSFEEIKCKCIPCNQALRESFSILAKVKGDIDDKRNMCKRAFRFLNIYTEAQIDKADARLTDYEGEIFIPKGITLGEVSLSEPQSEQKETSALLKSTLTSVGSVAHVETNTISCENCCNIQ